MNVDTITGEIRRHLKQLGYSDKRITAMFMAHAEIERIGHNLSTRAREGKAKGDA